MADFVCFKNFFATRSSLQLWSNFSWHAICLFIQVLIEVSGFHVAKRALKEKVSPAIQKA